MSSLGPIELLFLLAPLVVVPLALRLLDTADAWLWTRRFLAPAAGMALASFLVPRGPVAGALAFGWMLFTLLIAFHGLERLGRGGRGAAGLASACGSLLLPVGGGWLVLSRLGMTVLGFEEPLLLLTAVHFHYAAFATLTLVGQAGRVLDGRVYRAIVAGAVAGPLLVAAGITLTPVLELVGAATLSAAIGALALLTLARVVPRAQGAAAGLLAVSSLAALLGMACALAYAFGRLADIGLISLGQMARIHGPLNGLGFCLCGLLGWSFAPRNLRSWPLYR